jgi:iron complex transport system substrate-binding protein
VPLSLDSRRRHRAGRSTLALVLAGSVVLAGCGDDGDDDTRPAAESGASFPAEVLSGPVDGGETITVEAEPTSIVSLSPTATEMLWAIDAGDQVAAVDDQSDYPEGIPVTELSGFEPNVEAILGYEPDLVIASGDTGGLVKGLEAVDVPVLLLPSATDLDESYSQIERLGAATGHVDEAEQVVEEMRTGIEEAVAAAPDARGLTYFHELGPDLFSVSGDTFIGQVYSLFGLENIADAAGKGDQYPQLSSEYVVSADPDLVFIADNECCGVTPGDVAGRPGWQDLGAVVNEQLHVVDEDVTSRWGPRVVDFVEIISGLLAENADALGLAG